MSISILELSAGVVMLTVSGKLSAAELKEMQAHGATAIQKHGNVRILMVMTEDFEGWEQGGAWDDLSSQAENDSHIECMAIVGDKQWKDQALAFAGQGLREFPIEFFERWQQSEARAWLHAQ